jgi:hypothetical protein
VKDKIFEQDAAADNKITSGFQTAGGRSIAVKKELINQMKDKLFDETDDVVVDKEDSKSASLITSGFQTATGKSIQVKKDLVLLAQDKFIHKDSESENMNAKAEPVIQQENENGRLKAPLEVVKKPVADFKLPMKPAAASRKVDNSKSFKRPQLVDKTKLNKYIDDSNSSVLNDLNITVNDSVAMEVIESQGSEGKSQQNEPDSTFKNARIFNKSINDMSQISYLKMRDLEVIPVSNRNETSGNFFIVKPVFDLVRTNLRQVFFSKLN